jgi:hypothetical protein
MRPTFRKLEVKDIGQLEKLIADNVEGIEPGLKVVDSRLLLGQAAIDLVGLDSRGSLALIALDFTAHEGLLLRVMDAYSWCLEFPDTVRRLYPMAQVSTTRPPRILFIVERLTDSFLRRIKQLSFLEIDCLEFRHLEVNGESVVFFDHVERLRKAPADSPAEAPAPAPVVAPAAHVEPVSEPVRSEVVRPAVIEAPQRVVVTQPVRPSVTEAIRAITAEALKPVVEEVATPVEAAQPPVGEAIESVEPEALPTVVAPPAVPVVAGQPAVQEYQSVKLVVEPVPAVSVAPTVIAPEPPTPDPVKPAPALQLEPIQSTASLAVADTATNGHVAQAAPTPALVTPTESPTPVAVIQDAKPVSAPVAAAAPVSAPAPQSLAPAEPTVIPAAPVPTPVASAQTPPVWAKAQAQPNGNKPHFFTQATKSPSPAEAPAPAVAAAPVAAQPAPAQPSPTKAALEVDDRPELESLSFPKDGLSRQWLEFLSQLGATK